MDILLTGAYGRVGTALLTNLQQSINHFDQFNHTDYYTTTGEIANYDDIAPAIAGNDTIVHLAAASRVTASWRTVLEANIIGTYNCFEAARQHGIEQVVFASTNHVVGMYEEEHAPEIYDSDYHLQLDHETPIRPDSYYGTSKVFGEALGRYYVENYDYPKQVYVLRLGSIRGPAYDHPYADAERGVETSKWLRDSEAYETEAKRMKATWQSRRDVADMVRACLEDESVTYDIFYGTSDNERSWFDITRAKKILGYNPQDSGEDWEEPPPGGTLPVDDDAVEPL